MMNFEKRSRRQFLGKTALAAGGILMTSVSSAFAQLGVETGTSRLATRLTSFAKSVNGKIILSSDDAYDGLRRAGSFNPLTDKRPIIIVQCATSADVARSINFARINKLELAVRSGGFDVLGQSTCEGGVLIDLSLLQELKLDQQGRTVRVGAGVRGGQVDYLLDKSDLVVPFACHPAVGVSGLTLGGGLGWILGKHGTTADNVTAMEIITAEGRELRVTSNENPDLFWALRGGGGNFGVVTAFEYATHQLQRVTGGFLVYPIHKLADYLKFYRETMSSAPRELMIEISVVPTNPPLLVTTVCHSGSERDAQTVLEPIRKFGPPLYDGIHSTRLQQITSPSQDAQNFIESYGEKNPASQQQRDGNYNHWRGASIAEWTDAAITQFVHCINEAPPGWSMGIGHYMHGTPCEVEESAMPVMRDQNRSSYFFNMSWGHSSQSSKAMRWVDQSIKDMQPHNHSGTYINYLSSNTNEAVALAYGDNYPRLQKLKSQYDPDNIFHLNRNVRI